MSSKDSCQDNDAVLADKVASLEATLKKATDDKLALEREITTTKSQCSKVSGEDQMKALQYENAVSFAWTNSTIKKALQIRFACGTAGYNCLLQQHQPLPSVCTLQRRTADRNFNSGVLHQVFNALHTKGEYMSSHE